MTIICGIGIAHATHFPSVTERITEQTAKFGPGGSFEFPGYTTDPSCVGVPDNTLQWFNHTSHQYRKCFSGVATTVAYVMSVDDKLLTISRDTWVKEHMAIGNSAEVDKDPVTAVLAPLVLNLFERIITNTFQEVIGISNRLEIDLPAGGLEPNLYGTSSHLETTTGNPHNFSGIFGITATTKHKGSGVGQMTGSRIITENSGSGIVSQIGVDVRAGLNTGSGVVFNGTGLKIELPTNSGGGTIGELYGLQVRDQSGVAITHYNILSEGPNSRNKFEGRVDITGILDVDGATDIDDTMHVTGATDLDSTLNVDGAATFQNKVIFSDLQTGITADPSKTQLLAFQLTKTINIVTIAAGDGDSVKLPLNASVGQLAVVSNADDTQKINVFPQVGGEIDGMGVNAKYEIQKKTTSWFVHIGSNNWIVTPRSNQ